MQTLMKKWWFPVLFFTCFIVAVAITSSAFTSPHPKQQVETEEITIDQCDYLIFHEGGQMSVVHKGNCRNYYAHVIHVQ